MTKIALLALTDVVKQNFPDPILGKKALSIAVGLVVGRLLEIPSGKVDSIQAIWRDGPLALAEDQIGEVNETLVLSMDLALETARAQWISRYTCAYPNLELGAVVSADGSFFEKLNGISTVHNADTSAFCAENASGLLVLTNRLTAALYLPAEEQEEALAI